MTLANFLRNLHFAIGFICASAAWAQNITVVNGASYSDTIAPGSIFVVFGSDLAGDAVLRASSLPLETSLGGVSIRFTPVGGGSAVDALMVYTTRNQISALLPSSAAPGAYNVTVAPKGAIGTAQVVAQSIGVVSADSSGGGQAQAQIFHSATSFSLNRFSAGRLGGFTTAVAHPGEPMVLWVTGLGADASSDRTGGSSGDRTSATSIRIRLGGREFTPAFAGRASGLPGTDQINFTVPADAQTGCTVPLQVTAAGGVASNGLTLAIAPQGQDICAHPLLSSDQLRRMSEGGSVVLGSLYLSRQNITTSLQGGFDLTSESAGGLFARYGIGNLSQYQSDFSNLPGTCTVIRFRDDDLPIGYTPPEVTLLDAGNPLRLNGPNASNVAVEQFQGSRIYSKTLYQSGIPGFPGSETGAPTMAAGTYTLAGTGGANVGPFTATVTVPAPLNWTNRDSINDVNRSQPLNVTWSGGGSDVVSISGGSYSRAGGTEIDPIFEGAFFLCYQNASAGSFAVPVSVLSQLPASPDATLPGSLSVQLGGPANGGPFSAPLTAGGNIDRGSFTYSYGFIKIVPYR